MSSLAFLGAHKVNGVSALHTELMRQTVFRDLHQLYPDRIVNKTNGITFRRWLFAANPRLTGLLTEVVGERVLDDAEALADFAKVADDTAIHERLARIRRANKEALAKLVAERMDIQLDPDALFDVHIKRIHEYKRQLLNILETIALYNEMRARPTSNWVPRVKIFAGKAAASYHRAKLIIKLINDVAHVINNDPALRGLLKVVFIPDYNVSLAEAIIPAADLSEQISTAGHGGVRHRQHEAGAERGADDRHAGRCQYRDPRTRRRRQHLHLRPDRGRGGGAPPARARRARDDCRPAGAAGGAGRGGLRRVLAGRAAALSRTGR